MGSRTDEFNKKFLYTETNPEGIIAGKKGIFFFRKGKEFFVNYSGNLESGAWEKLSYRTVIIPVPPASKVIQYKKPHEIWLKTTDGFYSDETNKIMPKTGWKFFSYDDAFAMLVFRKITWHFPVPTSSYYLGGVDGNRSYDDDFFYAKIGGIWYRTPVTLWNFLDTPAPGEDPSISTSLPFVDLPLAGIGLNSYDTDTGCSQVGDQTYDVGFFYIKVNNTTWKRSRLSLYKILPKMALF
jgi:hypothetical protein